LRRDITSGVVVGIIAIPLGMAFAIAAGVKPEYGIYTTIIAGFIISLLGGSKFQIGGPTGAFVPVLLAVVLQYGYENLLIAGVLSGILLILMGLFKLGALIRYIPRPVTIGFTAGIAVIIFTGQIANFLGLSGINKHEHFLPNMKEIALHIISLNPYSLITSIVCLAVALVTPRLLPKIPGSLIGLVVSTLLAIWLFDGRIATIGSTFGAIPSTFPGLEWPEITFERIRLLIQPAIVIALLGGIESLLSAVVADGMTGERHKSNRELIAQGVANMAAPLFGGIPATGAIARTATNIKSGAASPIAGMVHSLVVLAVLVLFAPYASNIPLAAIAPILMVVAWNMSERREFAHILRMRTSDSVVLLCTFLITVLLDLTTAVEVGLILAVLFFVKKMSHLTVAADEASHTLDQKVTLVHVEGALFFGTASKFEQGVIGMFRNPSEVLLLEMSMVPMMDSTGEASMASAVRRISQLGGEVWIANLQSQPREVLRKSGLDERIGLEHIFAHTNEALELAGSGRLNGLIVIGKSSSF
jgi:SulP family sulfate permease